MPSPAAPPPRIGGPKSEGRKREHLSYNNRRKSHLTLRSLARSLFRSAIERTRYLPRSRSAELSDKLSNAEEEREGVTMWNSGRFPGYELQYGLRMDDALLT